MSKREDKKIDETAERILKIAKEKGTKEAQKAFFNEISKILKG